MQRVESMSTPFDDLGATRLLQHASWLQNLARTLVGDPARADDFVQETWLAALRRRPSIPTPPTCARNSRRSES